MTVNEFFKELKGNARVEGELITAIFISLLTSFVTFGCIYFFNLKSIEGFMDKYGFFLFFAILSYGILMPSIRQVRAFKQFPCMTGMMIGMTIGMVSGFLSGFYVGATNGMFWGSVFGMSVGIFMGVWKGRCCGIMGILEGLMAGFMGGLMGGMTAVMMSTEVKEAGVIIFIVCGAIMLGLNYMLYVETKKEERVHKEGYFLTVAMSLLLTIITIWLVVFGPRSDFVPAWV